jgi:hypothetical protein
MMVIEKTIEIPGIARDGDDFKKVAASIEVSLNRHTFIGHHDRAITNLRRP